MPVAPDPLDWAAAVAAVVGEAVPSALQRAGLSHATSKDDLRPGSHIYVWRTGFAYSHHGIVVHTEPCPPGCRHEAPRCCSVVHFLPPEDGEPGRIVLTSLAGFLLGGHACECRYGTSNAEFYLKRAGSCSVHASDPWPLVVLRALGLLEVRAAPVAAAPAPETEETREREVEYGMLTKNCELLALWCKLGPRSGVRQFRSSETAFSSQTAPGRFLRLGIALAVPAAAVAAATVATGTSPSAPAHALSAGSLAASGAARALLFETLRRPERAAKLWQQSIGGAASAAGLRPAGARCAQQGSRQQHEPAPPPTPHVPQRRWWSVLEHRRQAAEASEALCTAVRACLDDLGVMVPKELSPLLDCPWGTGRLCEMLVDALEPRAPRNAFECAAGVQGFLEELKVWTVAGETE